MQLGIFFKKEDNGEYTNDALLYQKILSFSLPGTDHEYFTKWIICKWLRANHEPFEKRPIESLQQLVKRKIDKLIQLQLIHEVGTQPISKGTGQTPVYTFDWMSYFLGWLIESSSPDPARRGPIDKVFNILNLMLEMDGTSSMNIFLKLLIEKIKENDLFMRLVDRMIKVLESDSSIKDISDLLNQTFIFRSTDLALIDKYNELWEETLNELEPNVKQLAMFRIKLLYEQRMKERVNDLAQFELVRYHAREEYDKIVLEGDCLSCRSIRYGVIDLFEYVTRLRYHIEGYSALEMDCPSCNEKDTLHIMDL